jgi:hypothetical protein
VLQRTVDESIPRERPQYALCLRACRAGAVVLGGCAIPMIWYDSIGVRTDEAP